MVANKTADYRPTNDEVRTALRAFLKIVRDTNLLFKVGRCAEDGKCGLVHRDMYEDAKGPPSTIWVGSPHKAAWLEKALTRMAWRNFPQRCLNEQEGGGDIGEDDAHHVYVVCWEPTIERLLGLYIALIERESGTD